ncbi:exocyst complex component Sec6 [Coprinopsis marcescibilis]|uniref:Exocyst complex component Sec6 n=1 Tax=Coprinopsis marcescibilis TaxID=230819 RepID=A0A5C3LM33_COPMA|nr:exocyst complex component Sec6 [Coprinopsis marcescibilis]
MAAPTISAAQAIGEYLQSPDDLVKVAAFRKKLEKEKASIDARLKTGVKEQLEATRQGLAKLIGTRDNVQSVRDEMVFIDRECEDMSLKVSTFDQISRVSMVHRNFESTEDMVSNLLEMATRLDHLEQMLAADSRYIGGPAPNLLIIHFHLNQLERFRNETMHEAQRASASSRETLTRWFERLNGVIGQFDDYFTQLTLNILPLVRAGHSDVVVRIVKIAEIEGKEDEKALVMRFVKKAAALKFKTTQGDTRVLKHYRQKIMKSITQSIQDKMEDAYKRDEGNPVVFLEGLTWVYQDILRVEKDVVPCFPPDYDVYSHYVREYHKTLNTIVKRMATEKLEATTMLALHEWIKEYKQNMKELNIPPELIEPPLLDGQEQQLIESYLQLIIQKLDEWTANLMKTEISDFTKREEPPEIDSDGIYCTQGSVILFQMVNQQIDLATESGQGAILARVVDEVNRVMRGVQEQWSKVVDGEFKNQVEKPEEVAGGLVEYCIALANDQVKSADYAEALLGRLEPLVSEKYRVTINERLNDAIDGYLDVAKKCMQTLIDIIFNDLKPATKLLFQQGWYDGIIHQIVETFRDYMADYQSYLNSALLDLMIEDLLDAFLLTYLNALASTPKLRMPVAADRVRADINEVSSFFRQLAPSQDLQSRINVLEMILAMLEASKDFVFLSFWAFAKEHGPNIAFVEGILRSRSDFDRSTTNEIMESIRRKVKDEGLTDPPEPTIMKKVSIQNAFTRFLRT